MIINSSALEASPIEVENLNFPALFWDNVADEATITSLTEEAEYPVSNLANPSTALIWRGEVSSPPVDEYLTVSLAPGDIVDYLALAGHNFGTIGALVSVEILVAASPENWDPVTTPVILPDDGPVIFRFLPQNTVSPQTVFGVRLRIEPGTGTPQAAVLFTGKSLVFERGVQGSYTPLPFGRNHNVVTGRSESGHFLGRIITESRLISQASFRNLTPSWVRQYLDPFLDASAAQPFFFAWSPEEYPLETGFAWLENDPQLSFDIDGYAEVQFQMAGVVIPDPFSSAADLPIPTPPIALSYVTSTTSSVTQDVDAPASGIIAGDILFITAITGGTGATPSGFTAIPTTVGAVRFFYKIADGTENGVAFSAFTGLNANNRIIFSQIRPTVPLASLTAAAIIGTQTDANPAQQTLTASSGVAPLVGFTVFRTVPGANVDPRTTSITPTAEVTPQIDTYLHIYIQNSAPVDYTWDMDDEGTGNNLSGTYLHDLQAA